MADAVILHGNPVGDRKTMVTGAGTTTYAYEAADRLTSVDPLGAGSTSYTFDDNGNLTSRGGDSFSWDVEDRLTSATVSSVTTTFAYNGDSLRDSLTMGGNTTTFTWDVNRSIPQVLDDEGFKYVYGTGLISQVGPSGTHYYLSDGLRSTTALTDENGDPVNTYEYDVFGALRASTGTQSNGYVFTGEHFDSSLGLEYLRARYYDPTTGRFISSDEYPAFARAPGTINRYIYAASNPVNLMDPLGLQVLDPISAMAGGDDFNGAPYWEVAIAFLAAMGSTAAIDYYCDLYDCDPSELLPSAGGEPAVTPPDPNDPCKDPLLPSDPNSLHHIFGQRKHLRERTGLSELDNARLVLRVAREGTYEGTTICARWGDN